MVFHASPELSRTLQKLLLSDLILLTSLSLYPGMRKFYPILSSSQSLDDQLLLTRQRIDGKNLYIDMREVIPDIGIYNAMF